MHTIIHTVTRLLSCGSGSVPTHAVARGVNCNATAATTCCWGGDATAATACGCELAAICDAICSTVQAYVCEREAERWHAYMYTCM